MSSNIQTVIIVHAAAEWRTFHRRAMLLALAETLPPGAALLCVNRPISLDVAPWKYPRKFWSGVWWMNLQSDGGRVVVATPRLLLHEIVAGKVPGATLVNRYLMRSQLRALLKRKFPKANRVIQWIYHPVQRWIWEIFPEGGKVFECYDEYARSAQGDFDLSKWEAELRLLEEADLTFATAQSLVDTRAPLARRLEFLPNGVPDFFFDGESEAAQDSIDAVPHPRVGYLGNIFSILDFQLLEDVFRLNPRWQLVLVGPVEKGVPVETLRKMPNVHFLGPRPYNRVPGVLRRMDAGLIPFVINDFTSAINPLKLYEYLAVGLPVVSTRLPELERFGGLVRLESGDATGFARAIEEILSRDRSSLRSQLITAVQPYSWTNIARRTVVPALRNTFGF
jgi:glycosyltransferase involved in cell wall biosynthesis